MLAWSNGGRGEDGMIARRVASCIAVVIAVGGCASLAGQQQYVTVTVVPWNPVSPPWDSTLWGIASHYHVSGGYETLAQINGISNPSLIRAGQLIQVPL
jgi:LysM domain